jgi:hypothetical protein
MNSLNISIKNNSKYKTEENKNKDRINFSLRNKIIRHNQNKIINNPIRILNNKSTFLIKPHKEIKSPYQMKNTIQQKQGEKNFNINYIYLKKNNNSINENSEERDNLMTQLYHINKEMNQINREIKELQILFSNEEKENMAHKYIISKILNVNKKVIVVENYDSPKNSKNKSFVEENYSNNNSKSNTIKIGSIKKGFMTKYKLDKNKNKTIPNSIKKVKTRNLDSLKIDNLKKELNFYQKMIDSKDEKLKDFKKKEGMILYQDINNMIDKKNKNFENLSKVNNDLREQLIESDGKIFDLSQKLYKMREKANDFLEHIDFYKNKISEIDSEILNLTNELTKRQKEEKEQEAQKSKEESEINSLINEKKNLEEEYEQKKELKFEQYDYRRELENILHEEKKYKLKNEVNSLKLNHYQKKNDELNQKKEEYEKERNNLLEKSKIPKKNKTKIEEMEKEMEKLIEEIEIYDKKINDINLKIDKNSK